MPTPSQARYALFVHYDGGPFHGWQLQKRQRTVQGALERVLERLTGARRPVVGSGRTDRGVHALGQVATVDLPTPRWEAHELRAGMNALLPSEVWVAEARRVPSDFHPRYDAIRRSYLYRVGTAHQAGSPFQRRWCWDRSGESPQPDVGLLERSAALIVGDRSFRRFAKAGQPQRGYRCQVARAEWRDWDGLGHEFRITANRYLHHMVRYLVGTMIDVATGKRPLDEMAEMVEDPGSELRTSAPAPPQGLFLHRVEYEPGRLGGHDDRDPPWRPQAKTTEN